MNGKIKKSLAATIAATCALSACACGNIGNIGGGGNTGGDSDGNDNVVAQSSMLSKPAAAQPLDYELNNDPNFCTFKSGVEGFAAKFAAQTYSGKSYAVSPVSVYMALAMSAQCATGQTKTEILNALGANSNGFSTNVSMLYRSLNEEYTVHSSNGDKLTGMIKLGNSIWVNDGTSVKQPCLDELANQYYCYSYSADFANDNAGANKAVREFVSEQTKGLIDKDFALSPDTLFALINTLYLKDVWTEFGDDLPTTIQKYNFKGKSSNKDVKLLSGYYKYGKTLVADEYSAFYTSTANGNEIKFIVPNDGYTIDQVFTTENIGAVNSYDFGSNAVDHENKLRYYTRCLFPEYKAKFDDDIAPVLRTKFGIKQFFDAKACDLSTLTDDSAYCSKVKHVTDLTVDKKGIEGAAVTVVEMDATAAPIISEYENVYETFTVDKSFGFVITNSFGTTLFSGVITDL